MIQNKGHPHPYDLMKAKGLNLYTHTHTHTHTHYMWVVIKLNYIDITASVINRKILIRKLNVPN